MSQLHQAHCLRQYGRHCRDKGDQQQAADDGHIVHKHVRHDLGKRGAAHFDAHEQGVANRDKITPSRPSWSRGFRAFMGLSFNPNLI